MDTGPRTRAYALAIVIAAVLSACAAEGTVEIVFLLPEDDTLSPVGPRLAEITLVSDAPGEEIRRETRRVDEDAGPIAIGLVRIADGVRISVELRSAGQRLIGYGESGPVDIADSGTTRVEIVLRRPFAYVTGGGTIQAFDATVDPPAPYAATVPIAEPVAVVGTRTGAELVVVTATGNTGGELRLVSTSTHQPMQFPPVPLPAAPDSLAVTPDDRYAIAGHSGAQGGISIVALADVRSEVAAAVFVPLGDVGAVAGGPGAALGDEPMAYAVIARATEIESCASPPPSSALRAVSLAAPDDVLIDEPLGAPIGDLAVDAASGVVALAEPCGDRVITLDPFGEPSQRTELQSLRGAAVLAARDGRFFSVGVVPAEQNAGAAMVIGSIRADGTGGTVLELPASEENVRANTFSFPGQDAELRLTADGLTPLDVSALPGGEHIAVLSRGYYHGEEVRDIFFGAIIPEMDLLVWEYTLIDAATSAPVQRFRTRCDLDHASGAALDDLECARAPGQDEAPEPGFIPTSLSVLYGAQ